METTASGPRVRDQSRTAGHDVRLTPADLPLASGDTQSRAIEIDRDCEQERSRPDDEPEECHVLLADPDLVAEDPKSPQPAAADLGDDAASLPARSGTGVCSITNRSPPSRTYECRVIEVAPRAALIRAAIAS